MPNRRTGETPPVTYPARGKGKPESPGKSEDAPGREDIVQPESKELNDTLRSVVRDTALSIEGHDGHWTSQIFRGDESPPSAAIHATIAGKRYLVIFQPTDMPDWRDLQE